MRLSHDHDLLTVDVWDTLLRRKCHPDAVKLHVARYLLFMLWPHIPSPLRDAWVLFRLRQRAEKEIGEERVSKGLDDEYRHLEVYRRWLVLAGLSPFPDGDEALDHFILTLGELELAQEKHVSYVDPGITDHLSRYSARQIMFLSDFYMSAHAIKDLVTYHRLHHLVRHGVVSCDIGLNKRSGKLFKYLHDQMGIDANHHLHLGDNLHSDVHAARAHGIKAVHYQPVTEHAYRLERDASFHDREAALWKAINENTKAPESGASVRTEAYQDGRRHSLLLVGFVLFVMERAWADRISRLYFFTREGEFFLELYRRLAAHAPLGGPIPDAQLLCVSRVATFAGSLREFSTQELMRLWNQYSTQSMSALFKSLGLDPSKFTATVARHSLSLDESITYPWQDPRVQSFLQDGAVHAEISEMLAAKRYELLTYLSSVGLTGQAEKIGIVDIGWRGTIQDNLAHALTEVDWHGYYLALNKFLNVQPSNTTKTAFGPDLNQDQDFAGLLDFVAPLEMVCNSPKGSVTGYRIDPHDVEVLRALDTNENRAYYTYSREFQNGVLDSVPFWAEFVRTHAYTSAEIRPIAMAMWQSLIQTPPSLLARTYFELNHNETFGVGTFHDKRVRLTTAQVWMALFSGAARQRLQRYLNETGWMAGILACSDISSSFRHTLRIFLGIRALRNRLRNALLK